MPTHTRQNLLAHLLLVAVCLVWGTTFVLVKAALAEVSPLLFNLLRMNLAAAVLLAVYRGHLRSLDARGWIYGVLAGVFLAAGYQLQTSGLRLVSPARSAFLTGTVVVFVPLLSLIPGLRLPGTTPPRVGAFAGAALGFCGLAMLAVPPGSPWRFSSLGRGELLTIACAFAFSLHLLTLGRASARVAYQALAAVQITVAALWMVITLPLFEPHPRIHLTTLVFAAWLISSLLSTAAAFLIQTWAQGILPASHTALILSMEPVFAALTGLLVLGEKLGGRSLLGAALVLVAILLSELFPSGGVQLSAHEAAPLNAERT